MSKQKIADKLNSKKQIHYNDEAEILAREEARKLYKITVAFEGPLVYINGKIVYAPIKNQNFLLARV